MKSFKELFANFLENPNRVHLRSIFQNNFGELDNFELKSEISEYTKFAKHILAIANFGGGAIIIGVEETNKKEIIAKGLESFYDKADVYKKIKKYIPQQLKYELLDFNYEETEYGAIKGKKFQVLIVEKQDEFIPYVSLNEGKEIRINVIYTRAGTNSIVADYYQIQEIINRRLQTEHINTKEIELSKHIQELKELYSQIKKFNYEGFNVLSQFQSSLLGEKKQNKYYPKEDFDLFISRLIEKKKKIIETLIK